VNTTHHISVYSSSRADVELIPQQTPFLSKSFIDLRVTPLREQEGYGSDRRNRGVVEPISSQNTIERVPEA